MSLLHLSDSSEPGIYTGPEAILRDELPFFLQDLLEFVEVRYHTVFIDSLLQGVPSKVVQDIEVRAVGWPGLAAEEAREVILQELLHGGGLVTGGVVLH